MAERFYVRPSTAEEQGFVLPHHALTRTTSKFYRVSGDKLTLRPDHDNDYHPKTEVQGTPKKVKVEKDIARIYIEEALSGELNIAPEPPIAWVSWSRKGFAVLREGEPVFIGRPSVLPKNKQAKQVLH